MADKACKMPTDAEEDWITAVRIAPQRTPSNGFENKSSMLVNSGTSANGSTAPDICSMPNISTAKPTSVEPRSFLPSFLENMIRIMPKNAIIGEKEVGFSSWIQKLSPCRPVRLKIQEVIVVPTLAPMIMPIAWLSFMIPALTNPTTITVVAEDDWITAVTAAPSKNPFTGFAVNFSRMVFNFPPACFSSPSPITCMPYKNNASPPAIWNTEKISILHPLFPFIFLLQAYYVTKR